MKKFTIREHLNLLFKYVFYRSKVFGFPYLSQSEIKQYQFSQIKKLLDIAYYQTPFYRKKFDLIGLHPNDIQSLDDYKHVPITTKEELIDYNKDFIDLRLNQDSLICSRSSGSNGKFVNLYYLADTFIVQELQVLRMLKDLDPNYCAFDKELLVYTSQYPFSSLFGLYKVDYINNLSHPTEIIKAINSINPSIIAIYPSILREILECCNNKLPYDKINVILTNSEQSTQVERDEYARICNCNVFDEFSSEELLSIAYQCHNKKYHLVQDCSYIELLHPDSNVAVPYGEIGEIVGTNLINFAMPIIRYRQGDFAVFEVDETCSCGKSAPIISHFAGRINSSFKKADGSIIVSGKILDWTYSLVLSVNLGIKEFEIVQHTYYKITANLVVDNTFKVGTDDILFTNSFNLMFGKEFYVDVHIVHDIPKTMSGKHIPIRSML